MKTIELSPAKNSP